MKRKRKSTKKKRREGPKPQQVKLSSYPQLFAYVNIERSRTANPKLPSNLGDLGASSNKILLWNCPKMNCLPDCKHDHVYEATVCEKTNQQKTCPTCGKGARKLCWCRDPKRPPLKVKPRTQGVPLQPCKCEDKTEIRKPLIWNGEIVPYYQVLNHEGRIWAERKKKFLALSTCQKGAVTVGLPAGRRSVPQILLNSFHQEISDTSLTYIEYKDGNSRNLCATNIGVTAIPPPKFRRKTPDKSYCVDCNQWLPLTLFVRNHNRRCRECSKAADRQRNHSESRVLHRPLLCNGCHEISIPAPGSDVGVGEFPSYTCWLCVRVRAAKVRYMKRQTLNELATKCENCGESNRRTLEFAHRNPEEKTGMVSNKGTPKTIRAEAAKTKVLCRFDHRIETSVERKFYQNMKPNVRVRVEYINKVKIEERKQCVDCKRICTKANVFAFDLDHVTPQLKVDGLSNMRKKPLSLAGLALEIAKCELRCANCHAIKTHACRVANRRRNWIIWQEWKEGIEEKTSEDILSKKLQKQYTLDAQQLKKIVKFCSEWIQAEEHCGRHYPDLKKQIFQDRRLADWTDLTTARKERVVKEKFCAETSAVET